MCEYSVESVYLEMNFHFLCMFISYGERADYFQELVDASYKCGNTVTLAVQVHYDNCNCKSILLWILLDILKVLL